MARKRTIVQECDGIESLVNLMERAGRRKDARQSILREMRHALARIRAAARSAPKKRRSPPEQKASK
jgi:hypothetical protein